MAGRYVMVNGVRRTSSVFYEQFPLGGTVRIARMGLNASNADGVVVKVSTAAWVVQGRGGLAWGQRPACALQWAQICQPSSSSSSSSAAAPAAQEQLQPTTLLAACLHMHCKLEQLSASHCPHALAPLLPDMHAASTRSKQLQTQ